jgi:hypothetical protein
MSSRSMLARVVGDDEEQLVVLMAQSFLELEQLWDLQV